MRKEVMQLKSGVAITGALISAGALCALYFTLGMHWINYVTVPTIMVLGYILVAVFASYQSTEGVSEFMRGFLIGWCSAANAVVILFEREALETASMCNTAAKKGIFRGPLHGVPMIIKKQYWFKWN